MILPCDPPKHMPIQTHVFSTMYTVAEATTTHYTISLMGVVHVLLLFIQYKYIFTHSAFKGMKAMTHPAFLKSCLTCFYRRMH